MDAMTIAVDLAKTSFDIAMRPDVSTPTTHRRLTRPQFERFLRSTAPAHVVMEACGTAHYWARVAQAAGHRVSLLPPHHVRPYVLRHHKTDRTDAAGLLEAARRPDLHPVIPKTVAQQEMLAIHRLRQQWMKSRVARINAMRGVLQEFGISIAQGPRHARRIVRQILEDTGSPLPVALRRALAHQLEDLDSLEMRIAAMERELRGLSADDAVVHRLMEIPGVGLLTSTAMVAAIGHIHAFANGRRLAAWLGLTPREHSSGGRRRLGGISKAGDTYLRMLLIHGARAALRAAQHHRRIGRAVARVQHWALQVAERAGYNKATVALANKLARTIWVVWSRDVPFSPEACVAA